MSRAGKFIPGGAARKGGDAPVAGANRTGPIRAPEPSGEGGEEPAKPNRKLFPKGGLRKPVTKNQRLPITIMSALCCGFLVFAAQYIWVVRPAHQREQQALADKAAAQKALADEQAVKGQQADAIKRQSLAPVTVKVQTKPPGATVTVGTVHTVTPACFTDVPPGTVNVHIHLDGYQDYDQKLAIAGGKPVDLGVINLISTTGDLSLNSTATGATYVLTGPNNYSHQGTLPDKLGAVPVGNYQLTAQQRDWKLPPLSFTVNPAENVQEEVEFPYATLTLDSAPEGAVVRNGRTVVGQTPLVLKDQRPGTLHLSLDLPPYTLERLDVDLPDSGTITKTVTLTHGKDFVAACGLPMVWIPTGFWAAKYDMPQSEFEQVAKYNPSYFRRPNRPVENISWEAANDFCDKLTDFERKAGKLPTGYHYSLPTESQWNTYSADANIDDAVTSRVNSLSSTQDVGASGPNKYGLYDTIGNVWEWCSDTVDDQGDHSLRGGSWLSSPDNFPSADTRIVATPKNADRFSGFRVVLVPQ